MQDRRGCAGPEGQLKFRVQKKRSDRRSSGRDSVSSKAVDDREASGQLRTVGEPAAMEHTIGNAHTAEMEQLVASSSALNLQEAGGTLSVSRLHGYRMRWPQDLLYAVLRNQNKITSVHGSEGLLTSLANLSWQSLFLLLEGIV